MYSELVRKLELHAERRDWIAFRYDKNDYWTIGVVEGFAETARGTLNYATIIISGCEYEVIDGDFFQFVPINDTATSAVTASILQSGVLK